MGEEEPRTIVSGLVKYCNEDELLGRNVLVLANLKVRIQAKAGEHKAGPQRGGMGARATPGSAREHQRCRQAPRAAAGWVPASWRKAPPHAAD